MNKEQLERIVRDFEEREEALAYVTIDSIKFDETEPKRIIPEIYGSIEEISEDGKTISFSMYTGASYIRIGDNNKVTMTMEEFLSSNCAEIFLARIKEKGIYVVDKNGKNVREVKYEIDTSMAFSSTDQKEEIREFLDSFTYADEAEEEEEKQHREIKDTEFIVPLGNSVRYAHSSIDINEPDSHQWSTIYDTKSLQKKLEYDEDVLDTYVKVFNNLENVLSKDSLSEDALLKERLSRDSVSENDLSKDSSSEDNSSEEILLLPDDISPEDSSSEYRTCEADSDECCDFFVTRLTIDESGNIIADIAKIDEVVNGEFYSYFPKMTTINYTELLERQSNKPKSISEIKSIIADRTKYGVSGFVTAISQELTTENENHKEK